MQISHDTEGEEMCEKLNAKRRLILMWLCRKHMLSDDTV